MTNVGEGPVIALSNSPGSAQAAKKPVATAIDGTATLNGVSANPNLAGTKLVVSITGNRDATDVLKLLPAGVTELHQKGKKLLVGKTLIGTVSGGKTKIPDLTITFTSAATKELVQQTLKKVSFLTKNAGTGPRTIQMQLTNLGGQNSNKATRQITVQ